jgi:hypothetical protein
MIMLDCDGWAQLPHDGAPTPYFTEFFKTYGLLEIHYDLNRGDPL